MKTISSALFLFLSTAAASDTNHLRSFITKPVHEDQLFQDWKLEYNKSYNDETEEMVRKRVWLEHNEFIKKHNNQIPKSSYTLGHNSFSDMHNDEFQKFHMLGQYAPTILQIKKVTANTSIERSLMTEEELDAKLPTKYKNWVEDGAVTPVKNQGQCGSCWAFSATGSIEGANFIENGELIPLSEQILVDCDDVDHGCEGGIMENAFEFDEADNGLCSEEDYPYEAEDDTCKADQCTPVAGSAVEDYVDLPEGNLHALLLSIIKQPTSIAMQADGLSFQLYKSGVFDDATCGEEGMIDHGVLAVGFGHDDEADENYILVKNSWGETWGDGGYVKLKRHSKNEFGTCAILRIMTTPNVEHVEPSNDDDYDDDYDYNDDGIDDDDDDEGYDNESPKSSFTHASE